MAAVRSRRSLRPLLLTAALVAWLAAGGAGTYLYAHRYWLYRGFPPPVTPGGIARGRLELVTFRSPALRERRQFEVYLPPHYAQEARAGVRFPVLYLLHAAPGRPDGFFQAGAMAVKANELIARRRMDPMLLVVPFGKDPAWHSDTEWANTRAGRWMDFVGDVVRQVDRRFATRADRAHRGIAGLSEGGYGALNVALHRLDAFSVAESWSGYFAQTPTAAFTGASPAALRANSPAVEVARLAPRIRRLGLRVWAYQGLTDPIAPWRIQRFGAELYAAGAVARIGFFRGGHDWGLWRAQADRMLEAASGWFGRPAAPASLVSVGRPLPHAVWHRILFGMRRQCTIRRPPPGFRFPRGCRRWLLRHGLRHGYPALRRT